MFILSVYIFVVVVQIGVVSYEKNDLSELVNSLLLTISSEVEKEEVRKELLRCRSQSIGHRGPWNQSDDYYNNNNDGK